MLPELHTTMIFRNFGWLPAAETPYLIDQPPLSWMAPRGTVIRPKALRLLFVVTSSHAPLTLSALPMPKSVAQGPLLRQVRCLAWGGCGYLPALKWPSRFAVVLHVDVDSVSTSYCTPARHADS